MNARRMVQVLDDIKRIRHKIVTMPPGDKDVRPVYRQYYLSLIEWYNLCYRMTQEKRK